MDFEVTIENFEGPLDLMLHLIKENQLDLFNLNFEEFTKQYIYYIHKMEQLKLDIASEYLVMASELIELKSKLLLPNVKNEEGEEEDPREELVNRLLEYQAYKEITKVFQDKENLRKEIYTKSPENIRNYIEENTAITTDVTLDDLVDAFKKFLERKSDNKPLQTKITVNEISVSSRRYEIKKILKDKKKISFFELFPVVSREYVVATFLAILEMAKNKELKISQNDTFDDIICEAV